MGACLFGLVTHVGQVFYFLKKKDSLGFGFFNFNFNLRISLGGCLNFIFFQGMDNWWVFHYFVRRVFERCFDKHFTNTLSRLSPNFIFFNIPNLNSMFPHFLLSSPNFLLYTQSQFKVPYFLN